MTRLSRTLVLLTVLGAGSCNDDSPARGTVVLETAPAAATVGAPAEGPIQVGFRDPVRLADLHARPPEVFGRWSGVAQGTWQLSNDGLTAQFNPNADFMAGEWVTVTFSSSHVAKHSWGFWIESAPASLQLVAGSVLSVRRAGEGRVRSYGAYAGDFDRDGYSDLVIPNEDTNDLRVFMNDRTGGYPSYVVVPIPDGTVPSANEGADFDGDGLLDFAVAHSRGNHISVFLGNGAGDLRFLANHTVGEGVRGLCLADFDLDGDPDIVTANREDGGTVSVLLSDGRGGFAAATTFDTGAEGETACAITDANEDGIPDVWIGAIGSEEIVVLFGDGDGALEVAGRYPAGGGPWMMAAGDIDGDGHDDVLTANANQDVLAILSGDGTGGLSAPQVQSTGGFPLAVDVGDLDGDGDLDIVTSNFRSADFTVFQNDGGAVSQFGTLPATAAGSCAILHDRDGDGDLDMTGIDELDDLVFLFVNPG